MLLDEEKEKKETLDRMSASNRKLKFCPIRFFSKWSYGKSPK